MIRHNDESIDLANNYPCLIVQSLPLLPIPQNFLQQRCIFLIQLAF